MSICIQAINLSNTLTYQSRIPILHRTLNVNYSPTRSRTSRTTLQTTHISNLRKLIITSCSSSSQEILHHVSENDVEGISRNEQVVVESSVGEFSANESVWTQMVEIAKFSGPAVGLWLCGPLMSLIDTVVVGQGSSIELAALGPGTVFCDNTSYIFMFLSIATSNLVATSLAQQDKDRVQHQISILLFIGLVCGVVMFIFTRMFGIQALTCKPFSYFSTGGCIKCEVDICNVLVFPHWWPIY